MSDARQAIRAAEQAGAAQYSPGQLRKAHEMLGQAQHRLESGAYFEARRYALEARDKAISAREDAESQQQANPAPEPMNQAMP